MRRPHIPRGPGDLRLRRPGALSGFWGEVLGYPPEAPPARFATWEEALDAWGVPEEHRNDYGAVSDPDKGGPRLFFQKVPEGKTVKNRVHLDVRAAPGLPGDERMAALEAEAERLVALGATRLQRHEPAASAPATSSWATPRATSSASTDASEGVAVWPGARPNRSTPNTTPRRPPRHDQRHIPAGREPCPGGVEFRQ